MESVLKGLRSDVAKNDTATTKAFLKISESFLSARVKDMTGC
jgi:hypothetical protein